MAQTQPHERINLAFLGGEPLINRDVLRRTVAYAQSRADARRQKIGYSITTNGTLITQEDVEFFSAMGFAVTVSLDGPQDAHDGLRPFKGGCGSFEAVVIRIGPLLAQRGAMQVTARVTVTPRVSSCAVHSSSCSTSVSTMSGSRRCLLLPGASLSSTAEA